jgi:Rod binding domain-containing protein
MRLDALTGGSGGASASPTDPKLKQAAEGFEQALLTILAQQLQQTASSGDDEDGSGGGTAALGAYQNLLPDTLASSLEQAGGIGIAGAIERAAEGRS